MGDSVAPIPPLRTGKGRQFSGPFEAQGKLDDSGRRTRRL